MPKKRSACKRPSCGRRDLLEAVVMMLIVPTIIVIDDKREKHTSCAYKSGTHQPGGGSMKMQTTSTLSRDIQVVQVDAERGIRQEGCGKNSVRHAFAQGEVIWFEVTS